MKILMLLFILTIITSCSPSRHVVPLGRKERAVSISIGGPGIMRNEQPSVVPLSSISYAYGITKKTTRIAALHLTPLIYGVYHLEAGFLREFYYNKKKKIGFTGNLMGNFMLDHWDWKFKFYPQVDFNLYWHFKGDSHFHCDCPKDRGLLQFVYIGSSNWMELDKKNSNDINEGYRFLLTPHLGYTVGTKRTKFNLELKYYLPYANKNAAVITYLNPWGNYGAFGAMIGAYRLF